MWETLVYIEEKAFSHVEFEYIIIIAMIYTLSILDSSM